MVSLGQKQGVVAHVVAKTILENAQDQGPGRQHKNSSRIRDAYRGLYNYSIGWDGGLIMHMGPRIRGSKLLLLGDLNFSPIRTGQATLDRSPMAD